MSGEKTEEATPQKQRKAREDGDVSKSAEFTGAMVLTFAAAATFIAGGAICAELMGLMRRMIAAATEHEVITMNLIEGMLSDAASTYASAVIPVLIAAFAAAGFFTYVQIGALFTMKPLIPDMNKLNPVQGAKNIISKDKLVDLVRNVLKLSLMGVVGYTLVKAAVPDLAMSPRAELELSIGMMLDVALKLCGALIGGLFAFGVVDILLQRHRHSKKLKMSKDEVQREYKQSEGDPMLKGQRNAMHQEIMNDPGMSRVRDADAVVVNPSHVAVAIRYRAEESRAPQVIAAGKGAVALEIKRLARRENIPIVKNIPLARALVEVDLEDTIPADMYEAVAEVLTFVYQLRKAQ